MRIVHRLSIFVLASAAVPVSRVVEDKDSNMQGTEVVGIQHKFTTANPTSSVVAA